MAENLNDTTQAVTQPAEPMQAGNPPANIPPADPNPPDNSPANTQPAGANPPDNPQAKSQSAGGDGDLLDPNALNDRKDTTPEGAPEAYEAFNLPEGYVIEDEDGRMVQEAFKGLNLSQKSAQALIDLHCKYVERQRAAYADALARQEAEWRSQVRSRPEYEAERAFALQGMRTLVQSPEEIALFQDGLLRNHPAMWSMMVKVGKLVSEDKIGRGTVSAPARDGRIHVDLATL
jgi:hypothetical protein